MEFFLNALWRMTTQFHFHRKWFCYDKPNRTKNGHVPDGLYEHERSHADKERIGMRDPDKLNPCAAELRRRHGH